MNLIKRIIRYVYNRLIIQKSTEIQQFYLPVLFKGFVKVIAPKKI